VFLPTFGAEAPPPPRTLSVALQPVPAIGQVTESFTIVVTDEESGAPVVGATVTLRNGSEQDPYEFVDVTAATAADGKANLGDVLLLTYLVSFTKVGEQVERAVNPTLRVTAAGFAGSTRRLG
jgi:hypothetical protein